MTRRSARLLLVPALMVLGIVGSTSAQVNVALGGNVTLQGGPFYTDGWAGAAPAPASTVTDGVFLPVETEWDTGTVYWSELDGSTRSILIDLPQLSKIDGLIVQADDNDTYRVSGWDSGTSTWVTLWDIPMAGSFGMNTRPNPLDDTEIHPLGSEFTTDKLLVQATGGDLYYSISEVQAFGKAVPEPSTAAAVLVGLAPLGLLLRRRRG